MSRRAASSLSASGVAWIVALACTGMVSVASGQAPQQTPVPSDLKRPSKFPEFGEGFRSIQRQDWITAAQWMWEAEKQWPEDGESTRTTGRYYVPYLPRYYLGLALYRLGCYEDALEQFNFSILTQREIRSAKKELRSLLTLREECTELVRERRLYEEEAVCVGWREPQNPDDGGGEEPSRHHL